MPPSTFHIIVTIPCLNHGGTEMQTLNLVRALVSGGYRVTVCCYHEYDDAMVTFFRDAGAGVILMKIDRSQGLLHLVRKLLRLFQQIRPDVIHVQYMAPGFAPVIAAKLSGVRTIFATVHQPGRTHGAKAKILLRCAAMMCTAFFCVSASAEESWFGSSRVLDSETGILPGRGHYTIYNAIDSDRIETLMETTDRLALRQFLGLNSGPVIGVVGRLRREKGQDILIRAMATVIQANPHARLLVIGDGPDREKFQNLARDIGLQNHVLWIGQQSPESAIRHLNVMDVAVTPSRFEGFGLAAAEAMAAGLPVVASDVDGLREVVAHGKTGFLSPVGNSDLIAERITELLSDPAMAASMGRAGRQRVVEKFSMKIFTETVLSVYRRYLEL